MTYGEKYILLTFDIEEFDLPLEYHQHISKDEQWHIGWKGVKAMQQLLKKHQRSSTLFTTAAFAEEFPEIIQELSQEHEIASHAYHHSFYKEGDLLRSKEVIEKIISKPVHGFRMPRMKSVDSQSIRLAGYHYDSSVNPTWIPGRYNHFFSPRRLYQEKKIIRLPASVSPYIRIPLFWLTFKNFPLKLFTYLVRQTLSYDGYVCLYFHPWEMADIHKYNIPGYIKNLSGRAFQKKFDGLLEALKREAQFLTISSFLKLKCAEDALAAPAEIKL